MECDNIALPCQIAWNYNMSQSAASTTAPVTTQPQSITVTTGASVTNGVRHRHDRRHCDHGRIVCSASGALPDRRLPALRSVISVV